MKNDKLDAAIVLKALEKEAAPLFKKLSALQIDSQKDYDTAMQLTKELKQLSKSAIERQDKMVVPLKSVIAEIQSHFKPFTEMVKQTELNIKVGMQTFLQAQAAEQKKLEAAVQTGKIKKISTYTAKAAELEVQNSGVRKIWQAIEIDASKTPREYMVPDTTAIKEALKAGKKVTGWEWRQVDTIAI